VLYEEFGEGDFLKELSLVKEEMRMAGEQFGGTVSGVAKAAANSPSTPGSSKSRRRGGGKHKKGGAKAPASPNSPTDTAESATELS
jgi:hypothetical protein